MIEQGTLTQPEGTYWHFINADRCLGYGDGRKVLLGKTLKVEGEIQPYRRGLHASKYVFNALSHAPSPLLCLVTLGGKVIHSDGISVASERTVLWEYDTWYLLREYICNALEFTIARERKAGYEPDPRSITALEVSRRHLHDEATNDELRKATDEIWDAKKSPSTTPNSWVGHTAADYAAWLVLQIPKTSWGYQHPHVTARMTRLSDNSNALNTAIDAMLNEMLTTMILAEYAKEQQCNKRRGQGIMP